MIVWRDFGVSIIITDETSPENASTMALGSDIVVGDLGMAKKRTSAARAVAGIRILMDENRFARRYHHGFSFCRIRSRTLVSRMPKSAFETALSKPSLKTVEMA